MDYEIQYLLPLAVEHDQLKEGHSMRSHTVCFYYLQYLGLTKDTQTQAQTDRQTDTHTHRHTENKMAM